MMRSVTTIINAITYVLIAFVAVSLVVSSIMIGVITLDLRAGAHKRSAFSGHRPSKANIVQYDSTPETAIIGFVGPVGRGCDQGY